MSDQNHNHKAPNDLPPGFEDLAEKRPRTSRGGIVLPNGVVLTNLSGNPNGKTK